MRVTRSSSRRRRGPARQAPPAGPPARGGDYAILAHDPRPAGALSLTVMAALRVRVGDYRVIYEVDDPSRAVTVVQAATDVRSTGAERSSAGPWYCHIALSEQRQLPLKVTNSA